MNAVQNYPEPVEIHIACRYATIEGHTPDVWALCQSWQGNQEVLEKALPFLREGDKGMEFKLVKVTTTIEDV